MLPLLVVLFALISLPAAAQEFGWADSAGYKQQILKTGAIKQVAYSPDGTTLYSLNGDSLWHIHHWDAETGKLLRVRTIDKTPYKPVFSITISTDALTYSVCAGVLSDNAYHARIFSLETDSLLHDVILNTSNVQQYSAVFDSTNRTLWVMFRTLDNRMSDYGPSGTVNGGMNQYQITDDKVRLIRSQNGVPYQGSFAKSKNAAAFVGYYWTAEFFRGIMTSNVKWFRTFLFHDSTNNYTEYPPDFSWQNTSQWFTPTLIEKIHTFITSDGLHYFSINNTAISHWLLSPYALISNGNLPFIPIIFASSEHNSHVLFGTEKSIACYHVSTNHCTDTISTQFIFNCLAMLDGTTTVAFGSKDGYLRLMDLPYSLPNIPNDFRTDIIRTYTDSLITFSSISSKTIVRYQWDFGDGTTDTTENTAHRYAAPGSYTIRLILTDTIGRSDTIIKQNYITALPQLIPSFSATPRQGKAPLNVQFTDESQGAIISWKWEFGDGQTDTLPNPQHTYVLRRYYHVSLTINDGLRTKKLSRTTYIHADTIEINEFAVINRSVNGSQNAHIGQYTNTEYNNMYKRGLLGKDGGLYLYECGCKHEWGQSSSVNHYDLYTPSQKIGGISWTPVQSEE